MPSQDHVELRWPPPPRRVQEWLVLHGHRLAIDGVAGLETAQRLRAFQAAEGLAPTGVVDPGTWAALCGPLARALAPLPPSSDPAVASVLAAERWEGLREIPPNKGPVVRALFPSPSAPLGGLEGEAYAWCAAAVRAWVGAAAKASGRSPPFPLSVRVSEIARAALRQGRFVRAAEGVSRVRVGDLMLVPRGTHFGHVGLVCEVSPQDFKTWEGNTNEQGEREGSVVRKLTHSWGRTAFARLW